MLARIRNERFTDQTTQVYAGPDLTFPYILGSQVENYESLSNVERNELAKQATEIGVEELFRQEIFNAKMHEDLKKKIKKVFMRNGTRHYFTNCRHFFDALNTECGSVLNISIIRLATVTRQGQKSFLVRKPSGHGSAFYNWTNPNDLVQGKNAKPSLILVIGKNDQLPKYALVPSSVLLDYADVRINFRKIVRQRNQEIKILPNPDVRRLDPFQAATCALIEPPNYGKEKLDTPPEMTPELIHRWSLNRQLLQASPGAGKTPLLYCILNKFVDQNIQKRHTNKSKLWCIVWVSEKSIRKSNLNEILNCRQDFPEASHIYRVGAQINAGNPEQQEPTSDTRRLLKDQLSQAPYCIEFITYNQLARVLWYSSGKRDKPSMTTNLRLLREKAANVILVMDEGKTLWQPQENNPKSINFFAKARENIFGHTPGQLAAYLIADWSPAGAGDPAQLTSMLVSLKGRPWEDLHFQNEEKRKGARQSYVDTTSPFFMFDIARSHQIQTKTREMKTNSCPLTRYLKGHLLEDAEEEEEINEHTIRTINDDEKLSAPPKSHTVPEDVWTLANRPLLESLIIGSVVWIDARVDLKTEFSLMGNFAPVSHILLLTPIPSTFAGSWLPGRDWDNFLHQTRNQNLPWTFEESEAFSDKALKAYERFSGWTSKTKDKSKKVPLHPDDMHTLDVSPFTSRLDKSNTEFKRLSKKELNEGFDGSVCDFTTNRDISKINMRKYIEDSNIGPEDILEIVACYAPKLHVILTKIKQIWNNNEDRFKNIIIHVPMLKTGWREQNYTLDFYAICLVKYLSQTTPRRGLKAWKHMTQRERNSFDTATSPAALFCLYAGPEHRNEAEFWQDHTGINTANICLITKSYEAGVDVNMAGHCFLVVNDNMSLQDQQIGRMVRRMALRRKRKDGVREEYRLPWKHIVYHVMYPSEVGTYSRLNCDYIYTSLWNLSDSCLKNLEALIIRCSWTSTSLLTHDGVYASQAAQNELKERYGHFSPVLFPAGIYNMPPSTPVDGITNTDNTRDNPDENDIDLNTVIGTYWQNLGRDSENQNIDLRPLASNPSKTIPMLDRDQ